MEIIKRGTKTWPHEIVYVTKCKRCGCKFTYTIRDFKYMGFDYEKVIECPQCRGWVYAPLIKRKYKGR